MCKIFKGTKLTLQSDNIFVVEQAFRVLMVFGRCARDFIHKRAVTDVFPWIARYVVRLQALLADRQAHQTLMARQARSLLADMAKGTWDLMELLDLDVLDSDAVIEQVLDYACEDGQMTLMTDFKPIRQRDQDILWLKLKARRKSIMPDS